MANLSLKDAEAAGIEYPWLKDAVAFLQEKGVATPESFAKMPRQLQRATFSIQQTASIATLYKVKEAVADIVSKGYTGSELRKALDDTIELTAAQADTIVRTETKQAILHQWDKTVQKPVIKKAFPYVLYMPTADPRTRAWHAIMRGFVCEVGTRAYDVCLALQHEPNCRYGFRCLTEEQAAKFKISTYDDLPQIVKDRGY